MHMYTQAHRQEVWQGGGASINRTAGLLGKGGGGGGASHLAKYEIGGGGGGKRSSSQSGIKRGGLSLTNPPGYRPAYTHGHMHTHNAHLLTHMHMCVCVVYVYAYMYTHIHTYTEILLDSKYTLREVHFLQLELLKSPV